MRILVVEDDEDVAGLVQHWLKKAGYDIMATDSGEAALELIEADTPDLAVLDVGLPGMTGLDLLAELRKRLDQDDFPGIFLSARVEESDIRAGEDQGAVYLTKPFAATALLDAVNTIARRRQS